MELGIKENFEFLNLGPKSPSAALHYYPCMNYFSPLYSSRAEYPTGTQSRHVDELNQGGERHNFLWPGHFLHHRVKIKPK